MNLFDFTDPGLVIMPTHRLLKGISEETISHLKSNLNDFFDLKKLSMNSSNLWDDIDIILSENNSISYRTTLALYGLEDEKLLILRSKSFEIIDKYMPPGHSEAYKRLDVSLVDHIILEYLIGFQKDSDTMILEYSHDRIETINQVKDKIFQLAFILGPVNPGSIKIIADIGDRMPRKSTYFYPKAPAGLVFYKW
jgi:uncharacterized protein (DUF1015 family)